MRKEGVGCAVQYCRSQLGGEEGVQDGLEEACADAPAGSGYPLTKWMQEFKCNSVHCASGCSLF